MTSFCCGKTVLPSEFFIRLKACDKLATEKHFCYNVESNQRSMFWRETKPPQKMPVTPGR